MERSLASRRTLALIALCALVAAVFVGGTVSERAFHGSGLHKIVSGDFSSDGWIGQRAVVSVPGFLGGINSIELRFGSIRVGASEPARVALAACGGQEREFDLAQNPVVRLPTGLSCAPIEVTARALNFFTPPGERVARQLGVQLQGVSVVSLFKLPVVEPFLLVSLFIFFSLLASSTVFVAQRVGLPGIATGWASLAFSVAFVALVESDPNKLAPLAVVILGALIGMALYSVRDRSAPNFAFTERVTLLWVALLVGGYLRLYGIRFGLPSNFHPDEVPKVNAIMRMVDGKTLDPQYFLHPSLLLYLTYGTNTVLHLFGIDGTFRETAFFAGRLVSVAAGLGSILLTYLIGARLFSRQTGGIAACLLAVFPLHITCSRYLKEDSLLTFVVLLCVFVTVLAVQTRRRALLLVAGVLAGCTAGTKYSGILMAVVPASAPWLVSRSIKPDLRWIPWAFAACLIAPLGFLMTTPYALLNSAKFIKDFSSESRHMQTGHTVTITAWSQLWMYHFWRSIWPGISGVVAAAACVAFGFLLRRGRLEDLIVIGMALLFYLPAEYVKAKPAPQPERYILPCLPFIAIGLAELLGSMKGYSQRALRIAAPVCAVLFLALPLVRSMQLAVEVRNDTRDQMATWMKTNLPHGSKVLMDWKPYCPNFHGEYFEVQHIPRARIIQELDVAALRRSGADYLVVSSLFYNRYFSQPESEPVLRQRFREVFQRVPVITQFAAPSGPYGFHNPTLTLFSLKAEDFDRLEEERLQKVRGEVKYTSNEVRARAKW